MTTKATKREQLIIELMFSFVRFRKGLGNGMKPECDPQLPQAQTEALFVIDHAGEITLGALAANLCISPSAATQLVEQLVQQQYVVREHDAVDRRTLQVSLTLSGQTYMQSYRDKKLEHLSKVLTPLSDAELEQLVALHEKVSSNTNHNQPKN